MTKKIIIGGFIFALIIFAGVLVLKQNIFQKNKKTGKTIVQTEIRRSKAPGVIGEVLMTKTVDSIGRPLNLTSQFSKNDKEILLVTKLKNPKVGTDIEYVRYLDGKYIDHRSLKIEKVDALYASFSWELKDQFSTHRKGEYKVKLYTNGRAEKIVSYTVS